MQVGTQWEPILAANGKLPGTGATGPGSWNLNEAVPLVGQYSAYDPNVLKQHAIWLAESGIEWVNVDWTNNLWSTPSFSNMSVAGRYVMNGTTFAVRGWQRLEREEGIPCPKIALMMGMSNGVIGLAAQPAHPAGRRGRGPPLLRLFRGSLSSRLLGTRGFLCCLGRSTC